jgi:predicted SAM-dependent methyltransferase
MLPPTPSGVHVSHIDTLVSRYTSGWAAIDNVGRQTLTVACNEIPIGTVIADQDRPDLARHLGLEAASGFVFWFTTALHDGDEIGITFEDGHHLEGSPRIYRDKPFGELNPHAFLQTRAWVASYVLHGSGIEIGAAHVPVALPSTVTVRYVDRYTLEELRTLYPQLVNPNSVTIDIVADVEDLSSLPDESEDFVIANHVLEHTEDPIRTIKGFCRILRPGGHIVLAIPDKRESQLDLHRPLTTMSHLIQDHEMGPHLSRRAHYLEFVEYADKKTGEELYQHAYASDAANRSLHFHVWTAETFLEFMSRTITRYQLPIRIVTCISNSIELLSVFRKV